MHELTSHIIKAELVCLRNGYTQISRSHMVVKQPKNLTILQTLVSLSKKKNGEGGGLNMSLSKTILASQHTFAPPPSYLGERISLAPGSVAITEQLATMKSSFKRHFKVNNGEIQKTDPIRV